VQWTNAPDSPDGHARPSSRAAMPNRNSYFPATSALRRATSMRVNGYLKSWNTDIGPCQVCRRKYEFLFGIAARELGERDRRDCLCISPLHELLVIADRPMSPLATIAPAATRAMIPTSTSCRGGGT